MFVTRVDETLWKGREPDPYELPTTFEVNTITNNAFQDIKDLRCVDVHVIVQGTVYSLKKKEGKDCEQKENNMQYETSMRSERNLQHNFKSICSIYLNIYPNYIYKYILI